MKIFVTIVALLLHQVLGDGQSELASRASNEFSNKLYKEVAKEPGNVLVCPISLHVALSLLHQAAGGSTAQQMGSVLGLTGDTNSIKQSYKSLLSGIQDRPNYLKIATKLYPAIGYPLKREYVNIAQNYFYSDVEGVDYRKPQAAADTINKYVEEKTNNKIHDLIPADAITDLTRLIIINAVHFNANWKIPFPHAYEDDFKVTPTERVKTRMMTVTDYFQYKELPEIGAKMLKMDYENSGYSMIIVLPNVDDGLSAVERKLSSISLTELTRDMRNTKVEVTIPKFKLEQTIQLKDVLINMGLSEIFLPGANLKGLSDAESLFVTDVIQKTFINVHENGTEAAAATGFLEVLSAQTDRVLFYARRPFHVYLVHWRAPALVLFEGRFVGPFGQDYLEHHESEENIQFEISTERDTKVGNSHQQNNSPTWNNKAPGNHVISKPGNSKYSPTHESVNPVHPSQSSSGYDNNGADRSWERPLITPTQFPGSYHQSSRTTIFVYRKPQTSQPTFNGQYDQPYRGSQGNENERQQYY